MSHAYTYTRNKVDGAWDLTPPNLGPAVKAAFPGNALQLQCSDTEVKIVLQNDVDKPTLDNVVAATIAAFDPLAMLKTKRKMEVDQVTQVFIENLGDLTSGISLKTQIDAAVDVAAVNAIVDSRSLGDEQPNAELLSDLDRGVVHDYGDVSGAVVIDMRIGLNQKLTLAGSLSTADISIVVPAGPRKVTLEIAQGGAGGFDIPSDAWPSSVNWGSKGAPTFGDAANAVRFVVLHYRSNGVLYGHYDDNVF